MASSHHTGRSPATRTSRAQRLPFTPKITTRKDLLKAYLTKPPSLALKAIIERAKSKVKAKGKQAQKPPRHTRGLSPPTVRVEHRTYVFDETGEEMPYALAMPRTDPPRGGRPLLLALHGLGYPYEWACELEPLLAFAAEHGILIVAPLGYSEGGWYGAPDLTCGGDIGVEQRRSYADVMNVLGRVRAEFKVDPKQIFAWGFSMGGGGALHFAVQNTHLFRGIGLVAPAIAAPRAGIPPWTKQPDVDLSSIAHVAVASVYGTHDPLVSAPTCRELRDDLRAAGVHKLLSIEVQGGRHDCEALVGEGRLERMLRFIMGLDGPAALPKARIGDEGVE